jgi:lipooligosaccharide transport system permease protein
MSATPAPLRIIYRDVVFYRRIWKANAMSAFLQPILYLVGFGVGVGALVDRGTGSTELLGGASYFAFYATALLATTAMFTSSQEALWPTMDGFQWSESYRAMVATPLEPRDVAASLSLYYSARAAVGAVGVATVLALFDETRSWGLLAAIPAAILTGAAFAVPLAAWTATRTTDNSFPAILRFGIIPMFLFSGAFFPIEQLPSWLQLVALVTPLWHGVELCRGTVLGGLGAIEAVAHVAVLAAYVGAGWLACLVTFRRRLQP